MMELTPAGVWENFSKLQQLLNDHVRREIMKGVALRLSYEEEEAGGVSDRTTNPATKQLHTQHNSLREARSHPQIGVYTSHGDSVTKSDSDNSGKHLCPTIARTDLDRVSTPDESTPCCTKHPVSPVHFLISLVEHGGDNNSPLPGWTIYPLRPYTTQYRKRHATDGKRWGDPADRKR
ncbi:hypothetical protein L1987_58361 [Smallanthus sonchifolius]|uniref:Uncharacterized protein n=1 Tax=Smallanthus sonchifolius TaxID=185202 RepID=A0ACB9DFK6_9ASTR|nr:hypothetical protein L1987_58361 [Smallanthus sonchifolius]